MSHAYTRASERGREDRERPGSRTLAECGGGAVQKAATFNNAISWHCCCCHRQTHTHILYTVCVCAWLFVIVFAVAVVCTRLFVTQSHAHTHSNYLNKLHVTRC